MDLMERYVFKQTTDTVLMEMLCNYKSEVRRVFGDDERINDIKLIVSTCSGYAHFIVPASLQEDLAKSGGYYSTIIVDSKGVHRP
jgi:hypothetical protein